MKRFDIDWHTAKLLDVVCGTTVAEDPDYALIIRMALARAYDQGYEDGREAAGREEDLNHGR
jgi:hypothetical protein